MNRKSALVVDVTVICLSTIVAVILVVSGVLPHLLVAARGMRFLDSFIAGMFFISAFTIVPAVVVLGELTTADSLLLVAFFGGLGALCGDLIIFRFVKDRLSEDIGYLLGKTKSERLISLFQLRFFRWLVPFIGALIVASPFPDEIGLAMMGLSKMKIYIFIPISFLLNAAGILVVGLAARAVT